LGRLGVDAASRPEPGNDKQATGAIQNKAAGSAPGLGGSWAGDRGNVGAGSAPTAVRAQGGGGGRWAARSLFQSSLVAAKTVGFARWGGGTAARGALHVDFEPCSKRNRRTANVGKSTLFMPGGQCTRPRPRNFPPSWHDRAGTWARGCLDPAESFAHQGCVQLQESFQRPAVEFVDIARPGQRGEPGGKGWATNVPSPPSARVERSCMVVATVPSAMKT